MFVCNFHTNQSSPFTIIDNIVVERQLTEYDRTLFDALGFIQIIILEKKKISTQTLLHIPILFVLYAMRWTFVRFGEWVYDGVPVITLKLVFLPTSKPIIQSISFSSSCSYTKFRMWVVIYEWSLSWAPSELRVIYCITEANVADI